jgi:hypothetical protein
VTCVMSCSRVCFGEAWCEGERDGGSVELSES